MNIVNYIHHLPYIVDFRSADRIHTNTGRLQRLTRASRQTFWVASALGRLQRCLKKRSSKMFGFAAV